MKFSSTQNTQAKWISERKWYLLVIKRGVGKQKQTLSKTDISES